jgi:CCR4-NOT transcriptional regulation complex NOT5 subunit
VVVYAKFDAEQRDKMKANAEEIADKMDETEKVEEQVEEQKVMIVYFVQITANNIQEEEDDDEYRPSSSHETKPTPQKRRASKDHRKSTDHVEPKVMRSAEVASLPVDDLVPLGKTPLQSMLRKTQNVSATRTNKYGFRFRWSKQTI